MTPTTPIREGSKIKGVSCYLSRAQTGGLKGALGVAEDTADASITCRQTGPITVEDELAEGLRTPMPGMRNAGRLAVAANPLEFLGKGVGDYQANKMARANQDARAGLSQDKTAAITAMLRRLGGLGGGGGPAYPPQGANNAF